MDIQDATERYKTVQFRGWNRHSSYFPTTSWSFPPHTPHTEPEWLQLLKSLPSYWMQPYPSMRLLLHCRLTWFQLAFLVEVLGAVLHKCVVQVRWVEMGNPSGKRSDHMRRKFDMNLNVRKQRTWTSRPLSASVNLASTFWITSPSPAESTPAIPGENHVSHTLHRSVFRCILVLPSVKILLNNEDIREALNTHLQYYPPRKVVWRQKSMLNAG